MTCGVPEEFDVPPAGPTDEPPAKERHDGFTHPPPGRPARPRAAGDRSRTPEEEPRRTGRHRHRLLHRGHHQHRHRPGRHRERVHPAQQGRAQHGQRLRLGRPLPQPLVRLPAGWIGVVATVVFLAYTTAVTGSALLHLAGEAGLRTVAGLRLDPDSTAQSTSLGILVLIAVTLTAVTGTRSAANLQKYLLAFEYAVLLGLGGYLGWTFCTSADHFEVSPDNGWFMLLCPGLMLLGGVVAAAWAKWFRKSPYFATGQTSTAPTPTEPA
ncbi:hypothetical protein ACWDZ4_16370 [Streptomyces sp. NPDC003016]